MTQSTNLRRRCFRFRFPFAIVAPRLYDLIPVCQIDGRTRGKHPPGRVPAIARKHIPDRLHQVCVAGDLRCRLRVGRADDGLFFGLQRSHSERVNSKQYQGQYPPVLHQVSAASPGVCLVVSGYFHGVFPRLTIDNLHRGFFTWSMAHPNTNPAIRIPPITNSRFPRLII